MWTGFLMDHRVRGIWLNFNNLSKSFNRFLEVTRNNMIDFDRNQSIIEKVSEALGH
jgi:hypothetical protein